jgi:type I restriction enzyme S subunit
MSRWRRYPKYKPSGVEWLGEVPEGWAVHPLRRYLIPGNEGIKIGPFGSQLKLEYMKESGFKVYGQENVISGNFSVGSKFIDQSKFEELFTCSIKPSDLLITMMGTIGRCKIVPKNIEKGVMDSHLIRLRLENQLIINEFAALLIDQTEYVREQILSIGKGAIMQGLNSSIIKNIMITLPPPSVQTTIIASLVLKTAPIDALIANKERQIELLQEKRAARIFNVITKGLDSNARMKDSGVNWIGMIPDHWIITKLRRFCRLQQGLQIPQNERYFDPGENRLEYITIKSIHAGVDLLNREYIENPPKRVICYPDDILFARTGATGQIITNQTGAFHNNFFKVVYDKKSVCKEFLIFYLQNPLMTQYFTLMAGTTTIPDLNHDEFLDAPFILPDIGEQKTIVQFLNHERELYLICERNIQQSISTLEEYRTALISAAVTGKIDVRAEAR